MKIGTKSILFGAHCFIVHPFFVMLAWVKLYGFPTDIRLFFAFFLHDIGYWGKPDIDGAEGERHVETGAKIMEKLFGVSWGDFTKYHSRYYSIKEGISPSRLCYADKYSLCLEPAWLYLLRVNLSGEIKEFMKLASDGKYKENGVFPEILTPQKFRHQFKWLKVVKASLRKYVEDNRHKS